MSIYGQRERDICHPYITDIRRYTWVVNFLSKTYIFLPKHTFSRCKMYFVDSLLNNKTIVPLNLTEYRLILANSGPRPRRLSIRRYSARFRRMIFKYRADFT